jgi:hypothetical protein
MKWKRKILAFLMVLMFFLIPFSFAQASNTNEESVNEPVAIEIGSFNEDNSFTSEIFTMTNEELVEFENILSSLMDKIQSEGNFEGILKILDNLADQQGIIKSIILRLIMSLKTLKYRGFVVSLGHNLRLNLFKKNSYKIRQKSKFWFYTNNKNSQDRTIIVKPFSLKFDILRGLQFGRMTNFLGVFIYIAKKFPQKSTTFFIGTASRINGRQLFSFK